MFASTLAGSGAVVVFALTPVDPSTEVVTRRTGTPGLLWQRWQSLFYRPFLARLPAVLVPSFVVTGLFFHQVQLASEKGWTLEWIAACFTGYAVAKFTASPLSGLLIDRFSAIGLMPVSLFPLAAGLTLIMLTDNPFGALAYLVFTGLASGTAGTLATAAWAELFGVDRLGTIRALVAALSVLASGLAPGVLGWLIDTGFSMQAVIALCLGLVMAAIISTLAA